MLIELVFRLYVELVGEVDYILSLVVVYGIFYLVDFGGVIVVFGDVIVYYLMGVFFVGIFFGVVV